MEDEWRDVEGYHDEVPTDDSSISIDCIVK